ncbi:hypothetical protein BGX34_001443 [Mortierella sp. NVP85]|nr:hypothetical protein BGX34_001443 [Mortierella sp. NVP85]
MLSALSQPMSSNGQSSESTKNMPAIKSEPEQHPSVHGAEYEQTHDLSAPHTDDDLDDHMDYAEETPVHPLAPAPQSSNMGTSSAHSQQAHSNSYMTSVQPQQHQQLLKLKTEHGYSTAPSPINTPDIVMTNDDSDVPSIGNGRRASSEAVLGSSEATMEDDLPLGDEHPRLPHQERGSLTSSQEIQNINHSNRGSTNLSVDTPTTMTASNTPSSSRRPSLRNMSATLPRSALQEETIALFKQYRNLIPCAKCFSRNTIQRDGMSDGNLRFKCRPPVSMSLICNKSYSESKIRSMIAGVVYGHTLPDSSTAQITGTNPGDNVLALAPPPTTKSSRRTSTKNDSSPRIGCETTPERMQRLDEDQDGERDDEGTLYHSMDPPPTKYGAQQHQGSPGRRSSIQRRGSTTGDEPTMMEYDDHVAPMHPPNHSSHLQVPGTPPLDTEDSRYRPRLGYGRAVTPTGTMQQPPQAPGRQLHKLHHSHSHPNIGQVRHQQFLEQQEREQRGVSGMGYPQQQQRPAPRPMARRDSSQYLGGVERRSSHPSPVMNPAGPKYEVLSPALSSPPRSSPGHESIHQPHGTAPSHEPATTPTPRAHHGSSRYDENSNAAGYFQRRMSQPQSFGSGGGHAGLPPPLPSPLSYPYDRRTSEAEEYPQMHREKYERLNANTMLTPSSTLGPSRTPKMRTYYPPGSPNSSAETRQHPLDAVDPADDATSRQSAGAMKPSSSVPSPWMSVQGASQPSSASGPHHPSAEPMRYSHSMPMHSHRPPLRHHYSSSHLYYHSHRGEDREQFDAENDRDVSPDYQDIDGDGRARMRPHGIKRKSVGQSLGRSISNQNLYSTNLQHQHQYQQYHHSFQRDGHHTTEPRDLNSAMPRSSLKLTYVPNGSSSESPSSCKATGSPVTTELDTSEAMAMQLNESSRIVIEIRQPRTSQSYNSSTNVQVKDGSNKDAVGCSTASGQGRDLSRSMKMHRSISHPNLQLSRSSSSMLGYRASPSPEGRSEDRDDFGGPTAKKRKADTDSVPTPGNHIEEVSYNSSSTDEPSVAPSPAIQVIGVDYLAKSDEASKDGVGLGLSNQSVKTLVYSPSADALRVAKGSSYTLLGNQKEAGIDYSLFTRVETAGWRILIPPNVVASFRSDDFGLMLKPKGLEEDDAAQGEGEEATEVVETEVSKDVVEMSPTDQRKAEMHPRQHRTLLEEKEDEEEDVNVEGVSRIALRDDRDDQEMCHDEDARSAVHSKRAGRQGQHEDHEDIEMDKEHDELLEDD